MCRLLHPELYFNENSLKIQAGTKDGKLRYKIKFSKFKKARKVKYDSTYEYVQQLLATVTYLCCGNNAIYDNLLADAPPSLSTAFFLTNKDVAIALFSMWIWESTKRKSWKPFNMTC